MPVVQERRGAAGPRPGGRSVCQPFDRTRRTALFFRNALPTCDALLSLSRAARTTMRPAYSLLGDSAMKLATLIGSLLVALVPGAALAEFTYNNVEVSLIDVELDGPANVDGDGFEVAGSYDLNDRLFLFGEWQDQSLDLGIDGRSLELGAGLKHEINPDLDFVGTLSFVDTQLELGGQSADDDGLALGAGVRSRLGDSFELDALVRYVDFDESGGDTGFAVTGRYYFTRSLAVTFGTDMNDNVDTLRVGFRAEF
jgi:hypothetical protein